MNIDAVAESLETTAISEFLRSHFWFVPALQSVHILAVCLVLTAFVLIFLRSWAIAGGEWSLSQWSIRLSPLLVYGFAALLLTGVLQVLAEPTRELPNWVFQSKLVLIVVALPLAVLLVRRLRTSRQDDLFTKALSALLAVAILVLIFAGRWIAYV